jgi:hypothetical protein
VDRSARGATGPPLGGLLDTRRPPNGGIHLVTLSADNYAREKRSSRRGLPQLRCDVRVGSWSRADHVRLHARRSDA